MAQTAHEATPIIGALNRGSSYQAILTCTKRNSSIKSLGRRVSSVRVFGINLPPNIWATLMWGFATVAASVAVVLSNKTLISVGNVPKVALQVLLMVSQIIFSITLGLLFGGGQKDSKNIIWPRFRMSFGIFIKVFPLAIAYVFRIYSTNSAVGDADVSLYQCLRGASIVVTVLLQWPLLGMQPTIWVLLSCFVVTLGVVFPTFGMSMRFNGLYWGLIAGFCTAVYLVVIKYYLPAVNNDSRLLVNYNSVGSLFVLIPWALYENQFQRLWTYTPWSAVPPQWNLLDPTMMPPTLTKIWWLILASCVSAFAINITTMMLIRVSSPVVYDVFGVFKAVLLAVDGFCFRGEKANRYKITGIVMSVIGTFAFGKAKHAEHVAKVRADAAAKKSRALSINNPTPAGVEK